MEIVGDLEGILLEERGRSKSTPSIQQYDPKICESKWFLREDTSLPESAGYVLAQADHSYYQRKWMEAINLYIEGRRRLGDKSPLFQRITLESISRCHLNLEDYPSAYLWAHKLLDFNQSSEHKVVAHNLLATICCKQHNYIEESDHLQFCLSRQPLNGIHWFHLGKCYVTEGSGMDYEPSSPYKTGHGVPPCVHPKNGSLSDKSLSEHLHTDSTHRPVNKWGISNQGCENTSHIMDMMRLPKCDEESMRTEIEANRSKRGVDKGVLVLAQDPPTSISVTMGSCQSERISLKKGERRRVRQDVDESAAVRDGWSSTPNGLSKVAVPLEAAHHSTALTSHNFEDIQPERRDKCRYMSPTRGEPSRTESETTRTLADVPKSESNMKLNRDRVPCVRVPSKMEGAVLVEDNNSRIDPDDGNQKRGNGSAKKDAVGAKLVESGHARTKATSMEMGLPECTSERQKGIQYAHKTSHASREGAFEVDGINSIAIGPNVPGGIEELCQEAERDHGHPGNNHYRYALICYIRAKILLKPASSLCNSHHQSVLRKVDHHLESLGFSEEFVSGISQHCWKRQFGIDPKQGNKDERTNSVVATGEYIKSNFEEYWFQGILAQLDSKRLRKTTDSGLWDGQ